MLTLDMDGAPGLARGLLVAAALLTAACGGKAAPAAAPAPEGQAPEFLAVPTEEIPVALPSPPPESPQPYMVAPEDVLEISVYGDPDMTRLVPVRPDGRISYTFVGDVEAAGRTIEEVREELRTKLAGFLRSPEVTVIAKEFGRPKVYVGGHVRQPGIYYLAPRESTLADVVFRAGLTTPEADVAKAVLVRRGRLVPVDFARVLGGDFAANVSLENDDLVFVPEASERYVYVLGEVRSQTAIETTVPVSVLNVITRAGGVNAGVAKSKEIAILRGGLKDPRVAVVNFKRLLEGDFSQNITVRPGDIVYVPTTALGRYNQYVEQILRTFTLLFQGRIVQQGFQ